MQTLSPYAKAVVGLLVAAAGALVVALGPGNMNLGDLTGKTWVQVAVAVVGSGAAVWLVENVPGGLSGVAKAISAALTAGLGALLVAMADESAGGATITQAEWLTAFSAAAVATGLVYQATNKEA